MVVGTDPWWVWVWVWAQIPMGIPMQGPKTCLVNNRNIALLSFLICSLSFHVKPMSWSYMMWAVFLHICFPE